MFDAQSAQARLDRLVDPDDLDRSRLAIAARIVRDDPRAAAALCGRIRDSKLRIKAVPQLCYLLAPANLGQARAFAESIRPARPMESAYAVGMMAASVTHSDRAAAKSLIREAFDLLEIAAASGTPSRKEPILTPAVVGALLLPTVERADPGSTREYFWRAVALQRNAPPPGPASTAILALLLDRYDPGVARHLLGPSTGPEILTAAIDPTPHHLVTAQLAPILACGRALASIGRVDRFGPMRSVGERSGHQLIAALLATDQDRRQQAAQNLLQLWTPEPPIGRP